MREFNVLEPTVILGSHQMRCVTVPASQRLQRRFFDAKPIHAEVQRRYAMTHLT